MDRLKKRQQESKKKAQDNKILILFSVVLFVVTFSISYQTTRKNLEEQEDKNKIDTSKLIERMIEKNRLEAIKNSNNK